MPIKPPIRPSTVGGERLDDGTSEPLGTSPAPKEIDTATPSRDRHQETELDRQKKVFEKRAEKSQSRGGSS